MRLFQRVFKDIYQNLPWIFLYGMIAATAGMALMLSLLYFKMDAPLLEWEKKFLAENVWYFREGRLFDEQQLSYWDEPEERTYVHSYPLQKYLTQLFSEEGKGGTYIRLNGQSEGYDQVIFLIGRYAELTHLPYDASKQIQCFTSHDRAEMLGKQVQLSTSVSIEVDAIAPEAMDLYHPFHYEHANGNLKNTLFVVTKNFDWIRKKLPSLCQGNTVTENIILLNPTEEEIITYRKLLFDSNHVYTNVKSLVEQKATNQKLATRSYELWLTFFIGSFAVLFLVLFYSMVNTLKRKLEEYRICYLFGETKKGLALRIFVTALAFFVIPCVGTIYIPLKNDALTILGACLILAALAGAAAIATYLVLRALNQKIGIWS